MARRILSLIAALLAVSMVAAGCSSDPAPSPTVSGSVRADPDADRGAIVFLPGLAASELSFGPEGDRENLWPGFTSDAVTYNQNFGALGLMNTPQGQSLQTQTTSSQSYGSKPSQPESATQYPPVASSVAWCLPEPADDLAPGAHECGLLEQGVYADFGTTVAEAAAAADRTFVPYPSDWRLRPGDQASELHETISSLRERLEPR